MKKLFFIFLLSLVLTGCSKQKYEAYYTNVFDTFSTFTCYADNKDEFDKISNELHTMLIDLNNKLDIYNNYSGLNNLKTINDNAGIKPVKTDKDIIEILKLGKSAYETTDHNINIAMGSVLQIWHRYREEAANNPEKAAIPDMAELQEANKHTDINNIVIDEKNSTVFLKDKNTQIDVGAIAKGYCCNKANEFLKSKGVTSALLNLGGNIICINDSSKKYWKIGVQDPDSEQTFIDEFELANESAVTSGNYQRYYEYNGKKYHHIINPSTLMPADNNKSVTIICDDSEKGDMFSTALFILPQDKGKELADKNKIKAMWITNSGETVYNFK